MKNQKEISNDELKKFGYILGILIITFGWGIPLIRKSEFHSTTPWILAGIVFTCSLIKPKLLYPVHKILIKVGEILGFINTRIILFLVFYILFLPTGLIRRLLGSNAISKNFNKDLSYRIPSIKEKTDNFRRPF